MAVSTVPDTQFTTIGTFWKDIWRLIKGAKTSVYRDKDGHTRVTDASHFKGLSIRVQEEVNDLIINEQKQAALRVCKTLDTLADIKERSTKLGLTVLNNFVMRKPLLNDDIKNSTGDSFYRGQIGIGGGLGGIGGIMNPQTMSNIPGQDPSTFSFATPNVWISPQEAVSIMSQKGIPETIVNKKSKSVLLNGIKIKNPRLSPDQLTAVHEDMIKTGLTTAVVLALRGSLTFGGSLLYPVFRKDNPVTMQLSVPALLQQGVIGKQCIERFVTLDRWNTVHIPNWNPTAADFLYPEKYYIPFQGVDVHGSRCARIVTAAQDGYWGTIMTMGWGISDIPGWIESVYNYYNVMAAIPAMINQMSILIRTFEVDGILATEGINILDDLDYHNTLKIRQLSPNNPISIDAVGKIQAIERDFKEVPTLVRLLRQDIGGRANIAEELIWSSERGAFSSGDNTEGALEKLWENNKYIHKDAAYQLRYIAMLQIINALGKDRDVIAALPYTTMEFDNPVVANAETRAEIAANIGKTAFDLTSSLFPMDVVAEIISSYGDSEFAVRADWLDDLRKRQKTIDAQQEEKFEKEMELMDAQIDSLKMKPVMGGGGTTSGTGAKKPGYGEGYSRLEQHQKEKSRGTASRREALQKAQGKKLSN